MPDPARILIIRPSALGDVCRSVPVLGSLRRAYPGAEIDWLVQDSFTDAVWYHPALTNAVPFPRRELSRALKRGRLDRVIGWMNTLRARRYELVIDSQGLGRSGLFALWTGAAVRIGYAPPEARELAWLGVNRRVRVPPGMHAVERMLELVKGAGIEPLVDMRLYTGPAERTAARRMLCPDGGDAPRYAVVAPTSRWPGKRWPAERHRGLVELMLGMGLGAVAVVGGRDERGQCGALLDLGARDGRVIDLVGRTTVGELMALVQGAAIVIGSDSAALHMAVGFDRPLVGLFGPTRVALVGPYRREGDVIQHVGAREPLDHKDEAAGRSQMERIAVEEVADAVRARLA